MKEKFLKIVRTLKDPPTWILVLTYTLTPVCIAGAIGILFFDFQSSVLLALAAYTLFALAAITLSYTVYTLVRFAPRIKQGVIGSLKKIPLTRSMMESYGFRTVAFTVCSFSLNIAYGLFNAGMGIAYRSVWYGALAAYYILFTVLRGGLLLSKRKEQTENETLRQARAYRNCGILVLVLNIVLSSAIAQMIFENRGFTYAGWTVYAFAAYAFWKTGMSIYNAFKAQKQEDMTVRAIRHSNLVSAAVSILALQTALLGTFASENVDISLYNTLTGCAVSALSIAVGVYMVVKGRKQLKQIASEKERYGE